MTVAANKLIGWKSCRDEDKEIEKEEEGDENDSLIQHLLVIFYNKSEVS